MGQECQSDECVNLKAEIFRVERMTVAGCFVRWVVYTGHRFGGLFFFFFLLSGKF